MLVREVPYHSNEFGHRLRKEPGMATKKIASPVVEKVQPYLEGVAKSLVERIYGPNGLPWGTKLTELEDVVIAVRQALSEQMLAEALERQTQTSAQRPEPFHSVSSTVSRSTGSLASTEGIFTSMSSISVSYIPVR